MQHRPFPPLLILVVLALVLVSVGHGSEALASSDGASSAADAPDAATAAGLRSSSGHGVARVRPGTRVTLLAAPDGPMLNRVGDRTEFGSPRVFSVLAVRGAWLAVHDHRRANGLVSWVDGRDPALVLDQTELSMTADLSERRLVLRRGSEVLRTVRVAVGRPGSSTPTGRFAVTDKLAGPRFGRYFGCCVLALSGTQPHLPPGWRGGNRLAIHGTDRPGTIGRRSSAGCLRAGERPLRALMRDVPLGTPVEIRR
jgi:hypothetical protein